MAKKSYEKVLDSIGTAIESLFKGQDATQPTVSSNGLKQTCLERFGMEARHKHILRNGWRKDLEYSKPLVDAEYLIQSEFKVSSYADTIYEEEVSDYNKINELANKRKQREEEAIQKSNNVQGGKQEDEAKKPKETLINKPTITPITVND